MKSLVTQPFMSQGENDAYDIQYPFNKMKT